jgi:hypothetical protein
MDIPRLISHVKEYGLYKEFIYGIPNNMLQTSKKPFQFGLALKIYSKSWHQRINEKIIFIEAIVQQ